MHGFNGINITTIKLNYVKCIYNVLYLEPAGQRAQQFYFDRQSDKSRHAAVWDGWCELHRDGAFFIVHLF